MHSTRFSSRFIVGTLVASSVALPRVADAQPIAPTRDELTRNQPAEAPRRPTLNVLGGIERSPCPLADPRYADVTVTLTEVRFNNLKGATPEELRPSWATYVNTPQPVAVLCEVRDAAATILRGKGYLAAVQVPTQRIENGVVTMETLFARVTVVRARGQTGGAEAKLAGYLSKLIEDDIFDRNRALAEALANQGLQQSNLGNFGAAARLLARADAAAPIGDGVSQRLARNYHAINNLNQRDPASALSDLDKPVSPVAEDEASDEGRSLPATGRCPTMLMRPNSWSAECSARARDSRWRRRWARRNAD